MKEMILELRNKIEKPIVTREMFWFIQNKLKQNPKVYNWIIRNK